MRIALISILLGAIAIAAGQAWPGNPAAGAEGNASAGRKIFKQCRNCHSLRAGKYDTFGPNLYQLVGRQAGIAPEYDYTPALAAAGFVWTPERIDRWLADPLAFVPGSEMDFQLESAQARADVIAYLIAAGKR